MTTLILNIKNTVISENSLIQNLFYKFWYKFSAVGGVGANMSFVYACCLFGICLCMYATTCRTLIYKVLNLAVLSVLVVGLWAYLTDITFIYVVYVLTFVSAVVMLFLSVVLMLPISAMSTTPTKNISPITFGTLITFFDSALEISFYLFIFVGAYLLFALYKTRVYRSTSRFYGHPDLVIKFSPLNNEKKIDDKLIKLESEYVLKVFSSPSSNAAAVQSCIKYRPIPNNINFSFNKPINSPEYSTGDDLARVYNYGRLNAKIEATGGGFTPTSLPIYVKAFPKYFFKFSYNLKAYKIISHLLYVVSEFFEFYFKVVEPSIFNENKVYRRFTLSLKDSLGITNKNKSLANEWHDENGWRTQCRFYDSRAPYVDCVAIFVVHRPWWSPFQVFRSSNNSPTGGDHTLNIISEARIFIAEKLERCKELIKNQNNDITEHWAYLVNKIDLIFLKDFVKLVTFRFTSMHSELAAQVYNTLSIFLAAVPFGYIGIINSVYNGTVSGEVIHKNIENLLAIQQHLYVFGPLFMIVSAVGLLVALIGAPLFISPMQIVESAPSKENAIIKFDK